MREKSHARVKERVENYPQSFKNEWKINGYRVLISTQIPQFWDTSERSLMFYENEHFLFF